MKILVTGEQGSVGTLLVKELKKVPSHEILLLDCDLTNPEQVAQRINSIGPLDMVVHLAAISHPLTVEKNPVTSRAVNVDGTRLLINLIKNLNSKTIFVFASTAQVYDPAHFSDFPISETNPVKPQNLYAAQKLECEEIIEQTTKDSNLRGLILRFFNHTHKNQPKTTFLPSMHERLLHEEKSLRCGNLELYRDIGALTDLVEALTLLIEKADTLDYRFGAPIYNISNGRPRKLSNLLQLLAKELKKSPTILVDQQLFRPGEPTFVVGDSSKLQNFLKWKPKISTDEELIKSFLSES